MASTWWLLSFVALFSIHIGLKWLVTTKYQRFLTEIQNVLIDTIMDKYMSQMMFFTIGYIKRRYCVIIYMSVTLGFPILVRFPSDRWFICLNTCFLHQYISSVFHRRLSLSVATERARAVRKRGGGGKVHAGGKLLFADVRAELFQHAIYCAKTRPYSGSQLAPGPSGDWGGEIHGSCGSTTSQPWLGVGH